MTNPFRFSGPVAGEDLIDRGAEAQALLDLAEQGNNSRLVAPRRYGKTSLLGAVARRAEDEGWATVTVDFYGVASIADITERIELAYRSQLQGPAARWFEGVRRTLRPTVRASAGPVAAQVTAEAPTTALLERLALPRRVHERLGVRVLVVFDEFQEVLTASGSVDAVIRSEIQHHVDVASYVFAGSHVAMMAHLFGDPRRAFYAQAAPVALGRLPSEDTADFVAGRFTDTGKDVGRGLSPLLDAADGHPQRTMLLSHALWEVTPARGAADEPLFARALDAAMVGLSEEFRVLWSGLAAGQRRTLAAIADGGSPYARTETGTRPGGATGHALAALEGRGELAAERSAPGGYAIVDPLLARWVRGRRSRPG